MFIESHGPMGVPSRGPRRVHLTKTVHTIAKSAIKHVADLRHARHPLAVTAEIRVRKLREPAVASFQGRADGAHGFLAHGVSFRNLSNQFIEFHRSQFSPFRQTDIPAANTR